MFKKIREALKGLSAEEKEEFKKEINSENEVQEEPETNDLEKTETVEDSKNDIEEKSENAVDEKEDESLEENVEEEVVTNVEPIGNGVRIEDVVLKADLDDRLAAFEAKLDALTKENFDLKEQNSMLKEKYEEKDFGTTAKNGVINSDREVSYSSYDDYSKHFK